jgi:hypothetical protein
MLEMQVSEREAKIRSLEEQIEVGVYLRMPILQL